ncbi:MAG: hypothetical protein ACRDFC_09070 [Ignavibacteria bacterium]
MFNIYYLNIKYYLHSKLFSKFIWVINNFLTMECYRKLCNKLYWKKLQPGTIPYTTRCWLIFLSVISVIWLAFFFNPVDPANSNSPSRFISLLSKFFRKIESSISKLFHNNGKPTSHIYIIKPYQLIDSNNIFLWRTQETYLKTSALLI